MMPGCCIKLAHDVTVAQLTFFPGRILLCRLCVLALDIYCAEEKDSFATVSTPTILLNNSILLRCLRNP